MTGNRKKCIASRSPNPDARALRAVLRRDLSSFIEKTFYTVNPGFSYLHNWHIGVISDHLSRCLEGHIKRLIINLPPRSLKSICASVAFPAWVLGHRPESRIICVSYSTELARKLALDCRAVMESRWYHDTFPGTRLDPNKNTELEVMTTKRGFRLSTSTGGTLTGRGGNFIIIDDPMKPEDAMSEVRRESTKQWFDGTLFSRLDNKAQDVIIVIMQRLHVGDLAAHLLEKEGWVHLNIPAIAPCDQVYEIAPGEFFERRSGDVLHGDREPLATLEGIRETIGSFDFAAQYQQEPVPLGGGMIKWEWFPRFRELPENQPGTQIVQSWDTAFKAGKSNDFSVGTTWVVNGDDVYLVDVERVKLLYPYLKKRIKEYAEEQCASTVLIEDKGSGTDLIHDLANEGLRCIPFQPEGDKETRMHAESARIEAGYVHLPEQAPWLEDFMIEALQFPRGRHDDQIDSLSQFLRWHRDHRQSYLINFQVADLQRPSYWRDL